MSSFSVLNLSSYRQDSTIYIAEASQNKKLRNKNLIPLFLFRDAEASSLEREGGKSIRCFYPSLDFQQMFCTCDNFMLTRVYDYRKLMHAERFIKIGKANS